MDIHVKGLRRIADDFGGTKYILPATAKFLRDAAAELELLKAIVDTWGYTEEGEPLTPDKQVYIIIPPGQDGRDAEAVLMQVGRPVGLLDAVDGKTYWLEESVRAALEKMRQGETVDEGSDDGC